MTSLQDLIDTFDWAKTPIGPRNSQSLRTSVSICLASRFPILIWWGPDLINIYNDAYAPILGAKHPASLGARGRDVWPEIWHILGPMLHQVLHEGKATWSDDQLLMLHRYGYSEECYFTFSYSPILDESGGIGGIFTAVFETTSRVVGERRLDTLLRLAARAGEATTIQEACRNAAEILGANPSDIPFAALYLRGAGGRGERVSAAGAAAVALPDTFDWSAPPEIHGAISLPLNIPGEEEAVALLVGGVSPHHPLDDDYLGFFSLAAGHIASAIAKAKAYEIERQRAEALAELDRAKTLFFSNVSHELRTPLTLMLGPLEEVLTSQDGLADGARELLARVDAHLRLSRLRREAQKAIRESEAKSSTAFGRSPLALVITSTRRSPSTTGSAAPTASTAGPSARDVRASPPAASSSGTSAPSSTSPSASTWRWCNRAPKRRGWTCACTHRPRFPSAATARG